MEATGNLDSDTVIRPHLEYLCIYNPDLDSDGSHLKNQVLYYYGAPGTDCSIDQQLRHIGLAQGVVALSREFADGEPLSSMETNHSRLVVKQIDDPNWWIVASFEFGNDEDSKDGRNIPIAEMLNSEISGAYRRWRLHHGKLDSISAASADNTLIDQLKAWWDAWCRNWAVYPTCISELFKVDHLKYARGRVSPETSEAATAILERDTDPGLIQMLVLRRNDDGKNERRDMSGDGPVEASIVASSGNPASSPSVESTSPDLAQSSFPSQTEDRSPSQEPSPSQSTTPALVLSPLHTHQMPTRIPFQIPWTQPNRMNSLLDNDGFVWTNHHTNRPSIDNSSICDLVNWIQECLDCNNNDAFLEPSGYVAHLNPMNFDIYSRSEGSKINVNDGSSIGPAFATGAMLAKGFASIIPSVSSAATSMGAATMTSVNQLMDKMTFRSKSDGNEEVQRVDQNQEEFSDQPESPNPPNDASHQPQNQASMPIIQSKYQPATSVSSYFGSIRKKPKQQQSDPVGPSDELSDSRFLIGLRGDLEDDIEQTENSSVITSKEVYLKLNINSSEDETSSYESCRILIYRRRPFIYVLVYRKTEQINESLNSPSLYIVLHRKLASLSEPFFTDLSMSHNNTTPNEPAKFYYLALNPSECSMQTSLPLIPKLPSLSELELLDTSVVERLVLARLELIQVHQVLAYLTFEARDNELDRFMRTSRGWWLYWTILPDRRIVMFARKASKRINNSPGSNGLLAALGKHAKLWLEEYKYNGKV